MNRCLSEPALLRACQKEATGVEHAHLRLCADCAERYDALVDDLHAIDAILTKTPPPTLLTSRLPRWRMGWAPVAAFVVLLAAIVSVISLRRPTPLPMTSRSTNVSGFAADVSAALFASADAGDFPQVESEPADLGVALEAGWACTQDRYFNGECNDQLSVLLFEASD
ncbi:MAG TPA: hypothetical protein VF515_03970 [Candidatus Binatia bacterium]|jgi:hypothetical protein